MRGHSAHLLCAGREKPPTGGILNKGTAPRRHPTMKNLKWNLILMSLLYLALGIFLLAVPGTALNIVCYALGAVVLLCAAVQGPGAADSLALFSVRVTVRALVR